MKAFWPEELRHFSQKQILGYGQYGLVYKAYNERLQSFSVVKVVEISQDVEPGLFKRFRKEIEALQKLQSPYIVQLRDSWLNPTYLAFEMEYVEGVSLEKLLPLIRKIPFPEKKAIVEQLIVQMLQALAYVHKQKLVHRDLKPSNILLHMKGWDEQTPLEHYISNLRHGQFLLKLSDFGTVKDLSATVSITRTKELLGTAAYIPPEQALGDRITPASDLYSLAVIWYELVSGSNPFLKKNVYQTIEAHIRETPPLLHTLIPEFPESHSLVIHQLLSKDPVKRFYSAEALLSLLLTKKTTVTKDWKPRENFGNSFLRKSTKEAVNRIRQSLQVEKAHFIPVIYDSSFQFTLILSVLSQNSVNEPFLPVYINLKEVGYTWVDIVRMMVRSIPGEIAEEFAPSLPDNSIMKHLWDFARYHPGQTLRPPNLDKLLSIPEMLKKSNWIVLFRKLVKFVSDRKPIILLLDGPIVAFRRDWQDFQTIIRSLPTASLKVVFGIPTHWLSRSDARNPIPGEYAISPVELKQENHEFHSNITGISPPKDDNLRLLLQYVSLYGSRFPVDFAYCVVHQLFQENVSLLHGALEQGLLLPVSFGNESYDLIFSNRNVYRECRKHCFGGYREVYKQVLAFFQDEFDPGKLKQKLRLAIAQQNFSEAGEALSQLFQFALLTGNLRSVLPYRNLITFILKKHHLSKNVFVDLTMFNVLLGTLPAEQPGDSSLSEQVFEELSGRYNFEKITCTLFTLLAYLLKHHPDKALPWAKMLERLKPTTSLGKYVWHLARFYEGFIYFQKKQYLTTVGIVLEALETFIQLDSPWMVPFGSYVLALCYEYLNEPQKAYEYAVSAIQTGKVVNDLRVVKETTHLIHQNSYYRKNQHRLPSWDAVFPEWEQSLLEMLNREDYRFGLIQAKTEIGQTF